MPYEFPAVSPSCRTCSAARPTVCGSCGSSDVEVLHFEGVLLDERSPGLHIVAHEQGEDLVSVHRVLDSHPYETPPLWVHGRLPELPGVHLAQSLVALDIDLLPLQGLERLIVVHVLLLLPPAHAVERGVGDEHVAGLDEGKHVAEEERQQQCPDVGSVDVRVRHDDDLPVARLLEVELVPDAGADDGHQRGYLPVPDNLHEPRLLHIEDLSAKGEHCLYVTVAALLRTPTSGVALDDEELALIGVLRAAVGELAREGGALAQALPL